MQLLGPWCGGSGECRGRGRQWDLLGRSCKVSAFFTSPLRLSDATPSFRVTPQCPPGIVSLVVSRLSCLNRRLARFVFVAPVGSLSLCLVSPTRIRGPLSTRSVIPSGPPGSPRQDPRTILLFPTRPGGHIVLAPGSVCILIRACYSGPSRPDRWCSECVF